MTDQIPRLLTLDWTADEQGASPPGSRLANWLSLPDQHIVIARTVREERPVAWLDAILNTSRESRGVLAYAEQLVGTKVNTFDETIVATIAAVAVGREPLPVEHAGLPVQTWRRGLGGGLRSPTAVGLDGASIAVQTATAIAFPADLTVAASVMTDDLDRLPAAARAALEDLARQINRVAGPIAATIVSPVRP